MDILTLQDSIVEDLKELMKNESLLTSEEGVRKAPEIYRQDLPYPKEADENDTAEASKAPYIIVRVIGGSQEDWNGEQTAEIEFIICVYDKKNSREGSLDVLHLIEKIKKHYIERPFIKGVYEARPPFEYALQIEFETYPYYFGIVETTFTIPAIRRNDIAGLI